MKTPTKSKNHWVLLASALLSTPVRAAAPDIRFEDACKPATQHAIVAAVGDILPHNSLWATANANPTRGFGALWAGVQDLLSRADISFANLEGPVAAGLPLGGSNASFNFPQRLIKDVKNSGFDLVTTANNHVMDRGIEGVNRTITTYENAGMPFVGTRRSNDTHPQWYRITEANGIRIAWVSCTFSTNGLPDHGLVLNCYNEPAKIKSLIQTLNARPDVDAVFLAPHWGVEYADLPNATQKNLATAYLGAGALAIVGSHPHVLEGFSKQHLGGRDRFVAYSLGNFVSGQTHDYQNTTAVLYIGLSKNAGGKAWINGIKYVPAVMQQSGEHGLHVVDRMAAGAAKTYANQRVTNLLGIGNRLSATHALTSSSQIDLTPECALTDPQ